MENENFQEARAEIEGFENLETTNAPSVGRPFMILSENHVFPYEIFRILRENELSPIGVMPADSGLYMHVVESENLRD